jgi:hypothetical protein
VSLSDDKPVTDFDRGINDFTWLMIRLMLIMAPATFVLNGLHEENWQDAFMYALALAVGLTPEVSVFFFKSFALFSVCLVLYFVENRLVRLHVRTRT